jgi:hypothetical protein
MIVDFTNVEFTKIVVDGTGGRRTNNDGEPQ